MDYLERERIDVPAWFIHVPPLPEQVIDKKMPSMAMDLIVRALEVAVRVVTSGLSR